MVSHLLFADDSLLLFRANSESAQEVKEVLRLFCQASGQQVNLDKSSIHFAKGCRQSVREEIKEILNVHNEALSEKYLGMPSDVGNAVSGAFKYLKDRVWEKVQGWMEQCLSAAGKEVLIKSVAQAIPTYSMSCFRLPRGLCNHLDSLLRKFWWGSKNGRRKTCWVAWEEMVKPKLMGGLGFRDFELFNLALLAKQAWRMIQDPASLSARILKAVYFPDTGFLEANLGSSPSRIWRSILDGRDVLEQGLIRRIGTGEQTDIWTMNWLPRDGLLKPFQTGKSNQPVRVSELIDQTTATWNKTLVLEHFLPMDSEVILNIPVAHSRQADFWAWHYEKKGVFSVRSAFRMLVLTKDRVTACLENRQSRSSTRKDEKEWTTLWGTPVPSKIRVFLWRLARHSLPTSDVLHHRNMKDQSKCAICGAQDSWQHSLLDCHMAKCVWALESEDIQDFLCNIRQPDARGWLATVMEKLEKDDLVRVLVKLWAIWYARRKAIHENLFQSPLSTHCFVDRMVQDLAELKEPPKERRAVNTASGRLWLAPPEGLMKLNVDAAVSKNSATASVAAVARNSRGAFLGASVVVMEDINVPETLEAMAAREGMALAADLGLRSFRLASDNVGVIRSIHSEGFGCYGHVVREIQSAAAGFDRVQFVHEGRDANVDAHRLARGALYTDKGRHVWWREPPDGVCKSYAQDDV
jgi:ribonuclease HI